MRDGDWGQLPFEADEIIAKLGAVPTLLERDNDVPALATLLAEAAQADAMMAARAEPAQCGLYGGPA